MSTNHTWMVWEWVKISGLFCPEFFWVKFFCMSQNNDIPVFRKPWANLIPCIVWLVTDVKAHIFTLIIGQKTQNWQERVIIFHKKHLKNMLSHILFAKKNLWWFRELIVWKRISKFSERKRIQLEIYKPTKGLSRWWFSSIQKNHTLVKLDHLFKSKKIPTDPQNIAASPNIPTSKYRFLDSLHKTGGKQSLGSFCWRVEKPPPVF